MNAVLAGEDATASWQIFVRQYGWRVPSASLARIMGLPLETVDRFRKLSPPKRGATALSFAEVFSLWHGRAPVEADWPAPVKRADGYYEWLAPELALLASLVGTLGADEIAETLTTRLRMLTGDPTAGRNRSAVNQRMNSIGLVNTDVVGGLTIAAAGREVGSGAIVRNAITTGQLKARRVGRLFVIPHVEWERFKAQKELVPEGYVQLSTLKQGLAIRSDKLSEMARLGYVPSAMRCNPCGRGVASTQFGTWYVSPAVAKQLLADRSAGRPMPWHGKPLMENLRTTYKLWTHRQHPAQCADCARIWGDKGAPVDFEDYCARYPALDHGAKRHLTRVWSDGLTESEVAKRCGCSLANVRLAIANRVLTATSTAGVARVTLTDATRWKARRCPTGDGRYSWLSLASACKQYLFTVKELRQLAASGDLTIKVGTEGAMRGIEYVSRQQCSELRARLGFTLANAARRAGVTPDQFLALMEGATWRLQDGIPLETVKTVIKRMQSKKGHALEEAAALLGVPLQWVIARRDDGTIKVSQAAWERRRAYLTEPMMQRLRDTLASGTVGSKRLGKDWMRLSEAAADAGVSSATLQRWHQEGRIETQEASNGAHYRRRDVRRCARAYWESVRFKRAVPPQWLVEEVNAKRCVAA